MKNTIPFLLILFAFCACVQNSRETYSGKDTTGLNITQKENTASEKESLKRESSELPDRLVLPGKSVGKTTLGMSAEKIPELLGKADESDAAMGKAWLTWYGKKRDEHNNRTELNIYTTYKDSSMQGKTVQQIRITSSFFETPGGHRVYNSSEEMKKEFPEMKLVAGYKDDGREIQLFDDEQNGIGFEFVLAGKEQICTGIIIHYPGTELTNTYIFLHPQMKVY